MRKHTPSTPERAGCRSTHKKKNPPGCRAGRVDRKEPWSAEPMRPRHSYSSIERVTKTRCRRKKSTMRLCFPTTRTGICSISSAAVRNTTAETRKRCTHGRSLSKTEAPGPSFPRLRTLRTHGRQTNGKQYDRRRRNATRSRWKEPSTNTAIHRSTRSPLRTFPD